MNRTINAAMLGFVLFLAGYCLCFWFGIMPKFYPMLGEIHFTPPPGTHITVKFVGSAIVGLAAGLVGFIIGRMLPQRASTVLHALAWLAMIGACVYLVGRETVTYILR